MRKLFVLCGLVLFVAHGCASDKEKKENATKREFPKEEQKEERVKESSRESKSDSERPKTKKELTEEKLAMVGELIEKLEKKKQRLEKFIADSDEKIQAQVNKIKQEKAQKGLDGYDKSIMDLSVAKALEVIQLAEAYRQYGTEHLANTKAAIVETGATRDKLELQKSLLDSLDEAELDALLAQLDVVINEIKPQADALILNIDKSKLPPVKQLYEKYIQNAEAPSTPQAQNEGKKHGHISEELIKKLHEWNKTPKSLVGTATGNVHFNKDSTVIAIQHYTTITELSLHGVHFKDGRERKIPDTTISLWNTSTDSHLSYDAGTKINSIRWSDDSPDHIAIFGKSDQSETETAAYQIVFAQVTDLGIKSITRRLLLPVSQTAGGYAIGHFSQKYLLLGEMDPKTKAATYFLWRVADDKLSGPIRTIGTLQLFSLKGNDYYAIIAGETNNNFVSVVNINEEKESFQLRFCPIEKNARCDSPWKRRTEDTIEHFRSAYETDISADKTLLAVAHGTPIQISVFDISQQKLLKTLSGDLHIYSDEPEDLSLHFSSDNAVIACHKDSSFELLDYNVRCFTGSHTEQQIPPSINPANPLFIAYQEVIPARYREKERYLIKISSIARQFYAGRDYCEVSADLEVAVPIKSITWSPDGSKLAATTDNRTFVWFTPFLVDK